MKRKCNINRLFAWGVGALLVAMLILLFVGSAGYLRDGPTVDSVTYVTQVQASVDGKPAEQITLPHVFRNLSPGTPVTIWAEIEPKLDDGVFIKIIHTPAQVFLNDRKVFEFGKRENYPHFMKDPATEIHIIETFGDGSPMELRVELDSPRMDHEMRIEPFMVSTSKEGILERSHNFGTSWIFSVVQMIFGIALILVSLCILVIDRKGVIFLWLGCFTLSTGCWAFGRNNFSITVFRSSAFLYLLSFSGLATQMIPLLRYVREIIEFENPRPLLIMEHISSFAALTALFLQLAGLVPCYQSEKLFLLGLPLMMGALMILIAGEYIHTHKAVAKWIMLPLAGLTVTAVMDFFSMHPGFERVFSPSFQLGSLVFLLITGVAGGIYLKDSANLRDREKQLEFDKEIMEIQLQQQRKHSLLVAQNEQQLRRQRHDLRHQLVVIQNLASKDNERLQGYLQALLDNIPKPAENYCENLAVNAVVCYFSGICRQHGISFTANLDVPQNNCHISDGSLCAVFGNLLENGVEACGRMESGRKFLKINSSVQYRMLTITMDNSFNGIVNQNEGRFRSSKRDAYGVGLASVSSIARENGGNAKFQAEGYVFLSSVYFQL